MALLAELKRRRVFRVVAGYTIVAFGVIQGADLILPRLGVPDWTVTLVIVLAALGLPIAAVLAWAFDATDDGIRREGSLTAGWRISRGRRWALGAVIVAATVVAGATMMTMSPDDETLSADIVAVLPFAVRGSPDLAYLGEGIVSLLSAKLDGAGALRTVDPRAVLSRLAASATSAADPDGASTTARTFGAGRMVLGDLVQGGDRVRLTATLYSVERDAIREIGTGAAEGRGDDVFTLVDSVAAQLLASMDADASRVRRVAALTTSSIDAFKAYIEGENAFRRGHTQQSLDAFGRAVALDSTFALAWYRLSIAAEYRGNGAQAQDAARRALASADRLSERDRRMLSAFVAWRAGDSNRAEQLYREHLASYPDEVEAWFELGEVLFHLNPMRGRPFIESEQAFRKVLEYEPGHVAAIAHLVRNAYARGDLARMDSLVEIIDAADADRSLENLALRAFAHGDSTAIADVLERIRTGTDDDAAFTLWIVGTYGADMEGAEAIADVLTRPAASVQARALGHATRAFLRIGRGRWRDAQREVAAARELLPTYGIEYQGALYMLPTARPTRAELEALRADLLAMTPAMLDATGRVESTIYSGTDGMHRLVRLYLLGLISADLGDFAAADSFARSVLRYDGPTRGIAFRSDYATSIRGRILLARGRPAEALDTLDQSSFSATATLYYSPFHNQSISRLMRAETMMALGRYDAVLPIYENLVGSSAVDLGVLGLGHLRQAEIHERAGRRTAAISHYRAFLELWRDPDPELAGMRDEARRALERLAGTS